jgi:hypothetical protein
MIGDKIHFKVEWEFTWMPKSEMAGAKELVDTYMASL